MTDFEAKHRPVLERALDPGETLDGVCAATQQQGFFGGRGVAIGVTPRRLIVQPLDRRGDVAGEPTSVRPEEVASADAGGVSGGWPSLGAAVMDGAAVKLTVKTTGGEKLKLMMMRGGGWLSGGEGQARGVAALAGWFARLGAR
jgi:hypothetical protein